MTQKNSKYFENYSIYIDFIKMIYYIYIYTYK